MRVKDWNKFQHFKDRKPPWIKLYRDVLDDIQWHKLEPSAAKALVMLWLIASEDSGNLPEVEELAFRLRVSVNQMESTISKLSHWLIQDDITAISERYHIDSPETETETEEEEEKRQRDTIALRKSAKDIPTLEQVSQYCNERKNEVDPSKWFDFYQAKGWYVGKNKMRDWRAAVRNWERNNYGGPFRDGYQTTARRRDESDDAIDKAFGISKPT